MSDTLEKILLVVFGAFLGVLLLLLRDYFLGWIYRPNIQIEVGNSKEEGFISSIRYESEGEIEWSGGKAKFFDAIPGYQIRIKVTNNNARYFYSRIGNHAVGYLTQLHYWNADKSHFEDVGYHDFIRLSWSYDTKDRESRDLLVDTCNWLDICATKEGDSSFNISTVPVPSRYKNRFTMAGVYRFTIQLSGENFKPLQTCLYFKWGGLWDAIEVMNQETWEKTLLKEALKQSELSE